MTPNYSQSSSQRCNRCHTQIPLKASFCGTCGERLDKQNSTQLLHRTDIAERYRITSLVRRLPYVQLFIAIDTLRQQPVVIRDLDISSLDEHGQDQAVEAVQQEHTMLRHYNICNVMPVIDLRFFQGHLYSIAAWPFGFHKNEHSYNSVPHYTLQDLLQSGIGLPDEQVAISWVYRLCYAVEQLHQEKIILGNLDPYAIIVSDHGYDGLPALMISWLPLLLRKNLPYISTATNIVHAGFAESLCSAVQPQSDIYSLGALLYLLFTGTSPQEPGASLQHTLRPSRDLTPKINSGVDTIIKRALAVKSEDRFQSAAEMADALLELGIGTRAKQAHTMADKQAQQTRVLKNPLIAEQGDPLPVDDSGDATIIAPLPQLRHKLTKVLTSSLKMRIAHMNEASAALANTEHPAELQSIIIEELSMGTEPTTETETMLEPSATKMDTVIEPPPEETKKVIESSPTEAEEASEPSSAEMTAPPTTTSEAVIETSSSDAETTTRLPTTKTEIVAETPSIESVESVTITGPLLSETAVEAEPALAQKTEAETETASPSEPLEVDEEAEDEETHAAETVTGPLLSETAVEIDVAAETDAPSVQDEVVIETVVPEEPRLQDAQVVEYALTPTAPIEDDQAIEPAQQTEEEAETVLAEPVAELASSATEEAEEEQLVPEPEVDALPEISTAPSLMQRVLERVSGVLPSMARPTAKVTPEEQETPLLKRLQRFVLGEQQHTTTAAALIETPLRIQPNQIYSIRIHMMGRDEPDPGAPQGGLSAVVKGDLVHIEVRSALYRNFAYIVQQADVTMPGKGFAAEITMPMQAFSQGPSGRRERLHIFFTDEARRPLYERPFIVEVFISHLVQSGREGHNVLSIPL